MVYCFIRRGDLSKLINYGESLGIDLVIPEAIRDNAITITDWEAGSRYDMHFVVRIDTLEKYFNILDEWYKQIRSRGIK